jgi:hypothetical protein
VLLRDDYDAGQDQVDRWRDAHRQELDPSHGQDQVDRWRDAHRQELDPSQG